MNKMIMAICLSIFAITAFACGGNGKDKEDEKKTETVNIPL